MKGPETSGDLGRNLTTGGGGYTISPRREL